MKRGTAITSDTGALVSLHVQLLKLASLINRPMRDGVAEPEGLSIDEVKIVLCLSGEGAMAGHEISDVMGIPPMNVSRALTSLLARGWIERAHDPADKRRRPVALTSAGADAAQAMTPDLAGVADYLLGDLSATDRRTLARISEAIIVRMEAWPADHPHG